MNFLELPPVKNEEELLERAKNICGLTFYQLAYQLHMEIPSESIRRKGLTGKLIELALGATAGQLAIPDFYQIGVELKTLPLTLHKKPAESTFVTSVSLMNIHQEIWQTSQCYKKLKRILWVPVEGDRAIPFEERRVGLAFLWSPSREDEQVLQNDWVEITSMIALGQLNDIDARLGKYLQLRPKASDSSSLCDVIGPDGNRIKTLPRGFYLRASFTEKILNYHL